jgi:UPF0042 nucleotide-binding protein
MSTAASPSPSTPAKSVLLVSGMSGAGKSTALRTLEDLGWETVDNLPLMLLDRLTETLPRSGNDTQDRERPLAIGIDTRTRGFDAHTIVQRIETLRDTEHRDIETLYLDCSGSELERRYAETRRRHPMAQDRPAADGIARERELTEPLRRWATQVIDTTAMTVNDLQHEVRTRFSRDPNDETVLTILSFGFSRGMPRNADLVFDVRFLRNPHWNENLKPMTGLSSEVSNYIAQDPAYEDAVGQIERLLAILLPRYQAQGKSYVTVAFGCTGGRHRSVHVAERVASYLRREGFSPTVLHRNIESAPHNNLEQGRRAEEEK